MFSAMGRPVQTISRDMGHPISMLPSSGRSPPFDASLLARANVVTRLENLAIDVLSQLADATQFSTKAVRNGSDENKKIVVELADRKKPWRPNG